MEYNSPFDAEQKSQFDNFELQITPQAQSFLKETAKWATFLSILGFIWVGLMVLLSVFLIISGDAFARLSGGAGFSGAGLGVFYLIFSVANFFPILYLFKFASNLKQALAANRTDKLTDAFENLKSHYKFIGILAIIGISLFVLSIVFGIVAAIAGAASGF
ncbi:MAG: DUF5362 family protein [Bacteroidota bacterium]